MKSHNGTPIVEAAESLPAIPRNLNDREICAACNAALARRGVPIFDFFNALRNKHGRSPSKQPEIVRVKRAALSRFSKLSAVE